MPGGYEIGVLADDLTGSLASAARLRAHGLRPLILWHRSPPPAVYDALVADMRTRDWCYPRAESAAAWGAWLVALGCRRLELRVDSTLRGGPDVELRGLLAGAGLADACVLAAPAFPEAGRITLGGRQRVAEGMGPSGLEVDVAERIFPGQPVGRIGLGDLEEGPPGAARAIRQARDRGLRRIVADAAEPRHLALLAQAVAELEEEGVSLVTVSSGGWLGVHPVGVRPRSFVMLVVASPTDQNREQLDEVRRRWPAARTVRPRAAQESGVDWAGVAEGELVIVETVADEFPGRPAAEPALLAATAASSLLVGARRRGVRCRALVASGGQTASCLVDALGAAAIQARGEALPLCPRGVIAGGEWDGLEVATKGGLVGDRTTLSRILDAVMGRPA
jgi:uncharacterized protein YgbK (DUF1537 family)